MNNSPRFDVTYCSQCGGSFGPGSSGFSHCSDHQSAERLVSGKSIESMFSMRFTVADAIAEAVAAERVRCVQACIDICALHGGSVEIEAAMRRLLCADDSMPLDGMQPKHARVRPALMTATTRPLVDRLLDDAAAHKEVAHGCDCAPEDTANWDHAMNCQEAAEELERLRDGDAAWSIFNSAGACVAENLTAEYARDWLTEDRAMRGWTAVYCRVARSAEDVRTTSA